LIGNHTEIGSDQTPTLDRQRILTSATSRTVLQTLSRTLLHPRLMYRLVRRHPSMALGLAIACGSAITTAGATGSMLVNHVELRAAVGPLAPAPPPPPAPVVAAPVRHRFLPSFHVNPLHGLASWYGTVWNGRKTASGETFDDEKLTAAHKTLPLGTIVRVTNLTSHRSVVVKINDRGTLAPNRIIDLSSAAARELGMVEQGLANVKLEILGKA
jgi:rare lipoprotein A